MAELALDHVERNSLAGSSFLLPITSMPQYAVHDSPLSDEPKVRVTLYERLVHDAERA